MKSKLLLCAAIIQISFGVLGIFAFVILVVSGQFEPKWVMTLVLAALLLASGVYQIVNRKYLK